MRMCFLLLLIFAGCVTTDIGPAPMPEPEPQPTPSPLPPPPPEPDPQPTGEPTPPEPDPQPTGEPTPPEPDPVPDPTQPEPEPSAQPEPQPEGPEPDAQPEAPEPDAQPEAPEPDAPPMPPMTECMEDVDCGADQQCYGLRCFPANEICYCLARTSPTNAIPLQDIECSKWGLPEFFDQDVPWANGNQTYFELRNSIVPTCDVPGDAATGEACMMPTDCQAALCLTDAMNMSFCSQRCSDDNECPGLRCANTGQGQFLCIR